MRTVTFVTKQSGTLVTALSDSENGINGNDAIDYDYSIIKIEHNNVSFDGRQKHVGLIIDEFDAAMNPIEFTVTSDSELNVSWYLKLDGLLDLEGESQLIQGTESELDVTSKGEIERDQQGSADLYTYNYWSSPVGVSNITSNNNSYTLTDVMRDGDNPINWITSGYNGSNSTPIGIADYWIWKYANQPNDDYSSWQHVRSTGTLNAGEGFTMKGPGSGAIADEQNYVFIGKPNNGDINLTLNPGNDYLLGNPYPSAIDADQFILDNGSVVDGNGNTTGTLYFWEHWGGGSHNLTDYQGGYATYTLAGGVPAAAMGTNDPDVGTGGTPTKTPGRYIPVSQGFFVVAEDGGTINFNNGQRIFKRESTNSVFMEANPGNDLTFNSNNEDNTFENPQFGTDERIQIRLGFNSVNTMRRQLLLTVDEKASEQIDWGYDGQLNEDQMDDLYWLIEDQKFTIQGIGVLEDQTVLPLGIHTSVDGLNTITLDDVLNAPENFEIYIHDTELGIYYDLIGDGSYEFFLPSGENLTRFNLVFQRESLSIEEEENEVTQELNVHYSNASNSIVLINPKQKVIKSLEMYNVLGQLIFSTDDIISDSYCEFELNNLSTGTYVLQIKGENGSKLSTKNVLVE